MELVSVYLDLQKARNWDNKKVRTLGGSYAHALKNIYGDKHVHVSLYDNRKAYNFRQENNKPAVYQSEVF